MDDWPFEDERRVAVFTTVAVMREEAPILRVSHDADDGAWQFFDAVSTNSSANAMLVALEEVVKLDPTVAELSDLPLGCSAHRSSPQAPWVRQPRCER